MNKDKSLDSTKLNRTHGKTRIQLEAHSLQLVPIDIDDWAPDLWEFFQRAPALQDSVVVLSRKGCWSCADHPRAGHLPGARSGNSSTVEPAWRSPSSWKKRLPKASTRRIVGAASDSCGKSPAGSCFVRSHSLKRVAAGTAKLRCVEAATSLARHNSRATVHERRRVRTSTLVGRPGDQVRARTADASPTIMVCPAGRWDVGPATASGATPLP